MQSGPALFWFRKDLRVLDNPALYQACQEYEKVVALYLLPTMQWHKHYVSPSQSDLIRRQLICLKEELAELNIELLVIECSDYQEQISTLKKVIDELEIDALYANRELEINEQKRDVTLETMAIKHCLFDERCLFTPASIKNGSHQPYRVFTPFSKACRKELMAHGVSCLPKPEARKPAEVKPNLELLDLQGEWPYPLQDTSSYEVGSEAVLVKLRCFVQEQVTDYKKYRDFPSLDGTSSLSPYLAIGALSLRQCVARLLLEHGPIDELKEGAACWLNELLWREFYLHLMVHWPEVVKGNCFKPQYEGLKWQNNPEWFKAWCEGRTGFPIVDAAMHQLNETGWMHNRLRMIVASFLCKDLLIDWRWGERYFMSKLIDGDFAANNGGWQWAASTGADAAPYFRIFNPTTQSQRFDPSGTFIRSMVKELSMIDDKTIHLPGDGKRYIKALVEHKAQREKALALYKVE